MTMPFIPPNQRAAWQRLQSLANQPRPHLRDLLSLPGRSHTHQCHAAGLTLDFSHQAVDEPVMKALLDLAEESQVSHQLAQMFSGQPINATEHRAVLHVALRGADASNPPWGSAIDTQVREGRRGFLRFATQAFQGELRGFTQEPITDVVNLGIGGSDLGPRMACEALASTCPIGAVNVHFVSNVDAWALHRTLHKLDPRRTLFVAQSKTFTTQETLTLIASAKRWLADAGCSVQAQAHHWSAVTAAPERALAAGMPADRLFTFWDWVGGRYAIWSAIGLPLAMAIGEAAFMQLLAGGAAMDAHVRQALPANNLPLHLALLGIWNRNFLKMPTHHLAPYPSSLADFVRFIQQMDMESNGKRIHVDGSDVAIDTGPVVWGGPGIDGQHAYFQLLHQGTQRMPIDFIGVQHDATPLPLASEHHRITLLNLRAQVQALAEGRTPEATRAMLQAQGLDAEKLTPHRSFPGNVPCNMLWLPQLDPANLGALIAAYEHKVFYQAAIWGIHAYDQWGVELGKTLAQSLDTVTSA